MDQFISRLKDHAPVYAMIIGGYLVYQLVNLAFGATGVIALFCAQIVLILAGLACASANDRRAAR